MPDQIWDNLTNYWYISGGVAFLISIISYTVDKFSYGEKDFLSDCRLIKDQNLSKKTLILKDFIEKVKYAFDNAQETEKDIYISFLSGFSRHNQYDLDANNIRNKFKLYRTLLLISIIGAVLSTIFGYVLLNIRIYSSIANCLILILSFVLLFLIRQLGSKLDDLRNHPDLLSST